MHEAVRKSLAKLPDQVLGHAPTMIARVLGVLQERLAQDAHLPNISYAGLVVKLGANDLANGFVAHVGDVLSGKASAHDQPTFAVSTIAGMSLEAMEGPDLASLALQASSERFKAVRARAKRLGLREFRVYDQDLFLTALHQGFARARIDAANSALIEPYACAALDAELLALYARFDAMLEKIERALAP